MRYLLFIMAASVAWPVSIVRAADLPQEANTVLAIRAMETAVEQATIAKQQFDQAFPDFARAITALKQDAAQAAYWRDACQSTPECGGKKEEAVK